MAFKSKGTFAVVCVALLALCGAGYYYFREHAATKPADAQAKPSAVPVTVVSVKKQDFPVYLTGLGTVEPYDTVTVSSRVDGEITKVFFKQGQMVQQGDVGGELRRMINCERNDAGPEFHSPCAAGDIGQEHHWR